MSTHHVGFGPIIKELSTIMIYVEPLSNTAELGFRNAVIKALVY